MTPVTQTPYLRLRRQHAPKLGERSVGGVTYEVLADPARTQLYFYITANDGGGAWSRETVPLRDIEAALAGVGEAPFPAKALAAAFVGRSSNNGSFLAAALVREGLIARAPDAKYKLVRSADWARWQAEMLAVDGESVMVPPVAPEAAVPAPAAAPVPEPAPTRPVARKDRRGKGRAAPPVEAVVDDDAGGGDAGDS